MEEPPLERLDRPAAPSSSGQELAARMPEASVEVLADAGHLPQLDQPAALASSINRFLGAAMGAVARAG